MNRGRNGKKDVRLFLHPGIPKKANNLIINSLWIVFYVEWHQLNQWYDDWRNLVLQTSTQKISVPDIFAYGKVRVIE